MEKYVPMRRCIGCMQSRPKEDLIRLTAGADGLVIDESGKAPGRGFYLCRGSEKCVRLAVKKRKLPQDFLNDRQEVL